MVPAPRCDRHPGARAAWRCRGCGAALCPGCAFVRKVQTAELVACARCRGPADLLTAHRSAHRSYAARLPGALLYPLRPATLAGVLGAAVVLAFLSYLGIVGLVVRYMVSWAFFFSILGQSARGARTFEAAELADEGFDLVFPALRGFLATAVVWVPALAWIAWRHGWDLRAAGVDPVLWLVLAAGIAYVPAALVHAGVGGRTLDVLNPLYPLSFAVRLRGDYAVAVLALVGLGVADVALGLLGGLARGLPVPVLSRLAAELLGLLAPTAMAHALGLLLHVRGDDLDYGVAADYEEPLLPGAVPRGAEPVLATAVVERPPEPEALDVSELLQEPLEAAELLGPLDPAGEPAPDPRRRKP